jgi:hypothetical protein
MTIDDTLACAGKGATLEGVTDGLRVLEMRVLDSDGNVVATFDLAGKEIAQPLASDEDTSSLQSHL